MISKIISNVLSLAKSKTFSILNAFLATVSCPSDEDSGDSPIGEFPFSPGLASVPLELMVPPFEVLLLVLTLSLSLLLECFLFVPFLLSSVLCPFKELSSSIVP